MSFINTLRFARFWPVSWAITHHFGVPVRFPCLLNYKVLLRAGHRHSPFWLIRPVSWAIAHLFEVLERFPRLMIPEVRLRVGHQHLQFWPILACFVDYYSPIWGPAAISVVVEPQGVLTCRSSTLAVLTNSGPFQGLLLTVLGSRSDFHSC